MTPIIPLFKGFVSDYAFFMRDQNRIAVLDGLRTLAIVLVLLRHCVKIFWPDVSQPFLPVLGYDLGNVMINGWMGVDLFFVLSGFLIAGFLLDKLPETQSKGTVIGTYAKRRIMRIVPAYFVVLTLCTLELFPYFRVIDQDTPLWWQYLYHLLFVQDYLGSQILVVFWSLAVEIKFYLIAPLLILGVMRLKNTKLQGGTLLLLWLACPLLRWLHLELLPTPIADYETFFTDLRSLFHLCLDGLLMGVLIAWLWRNEEHKAFFNHPVIANSCFVTGSAIIAFLLLSPPLVDLGPSLFEQISLMNLISLGFGLMMMGLLAGCAGHRLFCSKSFTFCALISYSLYLLHIPIYIAVYGVMEPVLRELDSSTIKFAILFYPAMIVTFIAATLLYVFIERPFIQWSKK